MEVFLGQLEECCLGIASSKATERRKSIDKLSQLLCNNKVREYLNKGISFSWDAVVQAMHSFLQKVILHKCNNYSVQKFIDLMQEAEKFLDDDNKKVVTSTALNTRKRCGDYLMDAVRAANRNCKLIYEHYTIFKINICPFSR